ncbi:helix-turn-helix transcriptional regulator [Paenibacillus allorhizosphaerae]|uniref:WYL domain-containing protein n=1 Tax=Paenibacillus allorhizosphaerae TaxID=2849866 RepID=A0ABN7TFU6_9BACL|nr:WYL domain-containing protein [Paenibacillus allorhizosphaerae]CAG7625157.1 hypothetical protein PAECIP111802_01139 [Paenibacillus allorhizosphaerae]
MSNLHRILWIDGQIRSLRYPNVKAIAERFEISIRQASRDLSYLRDTLGAPLQYSHKHQGYRYDQPTYALPSVFLTEEQKQSLVYLSMQYKQSGEKHEAHIAEILSRLALDEQRSSSVQAVLPYPRKIRFTAEAAQLYKKLHEAAERYNKVRISDKEPDMLPLLLSPYKLFAYKGTDYVLGYVEPHHEIRLFPLEQLQDAVVTDQTFEYKPLLSGTWFVQSLLRATKTAVVRFYIPEYAAKLHLPWMPLDHNTFRIEFDDVHYFFSRLLSCPSDFQILSPQWCVNRFKAHLVKILRNHTKV